MIETKRTPPPYRNWKVKQYTPSRETLLAQERAQLAQPPLLSLHGKADEPAAELPIKAPA